LFWPDDHAWCVATEIDTTSIEGCLALVDALVGVAKDEALQIDVDAPFADRISI
jgi:hypothetical protein